MSLLDDLSTGASASSDGVKALTGLSSLIFGGSQQRKAARYQQKLQLELMAQQQAYARENATTDYNRQRALVQDNALLEKTGRQQAGLSTAGDFGSGSASVSPIAAPPAGSAPSMPDPVSSLLGSAQSIGDAGNGLLQAASTAANNRLSNSQASLNEIDAQTRSLKNIKDLQIMTANAKDAEEKAKYQTLLTKAMETYGMENAALDNQIKANEVLISTSDATIRTKWNEATYNEKIAQIDNILEDTKVKRETKKNLRETRKNLVAERAKIISDTSKNYSDIKVNKANIPNIEADTQNRKDQHLLFTDTFSDQIQKIKMDSLPKNLYEKIQLWRSNGTFEKLDGFQQLGYGLYEALSQAGISSSDIAAIIKALK